MLGLPGWQPHQEGEDWVGIGMCVCMLCAYACVRVVQHMCYLVTLLPVTGETCHEVSTREVN